MTYVSNEYFNRVPAILICMDWDALLISLHLIGAVLGVGGVTYIEIFSLRFGRKHQSKAVAKEVGGLFHLAYVTTRIGMITVAVSGFAILLYFRLTGQGEDVFGSPRLWGKLTMMLIIFADAWLLEKHRLSLWLGSAISVAAWYTALILGAWHDFDGSFLSIIGAYAIAVAAFALLIEAVKLALRKTEKPGARPASPS